MKMDFLNWSFIESYNTRRNIACLLLSGIFVVGGVVNIGFAGFYPAIPFLLLAVYQLLYFKIKFLIIIVVISLAIIYPLSRNHSTNSIIFPYLDSHITIISGWGRYKQDTQMIMVDVKVSHADFGTLLRAGFDDENDVYITIGANKLLQAIDEGKIESDSLTGVSNLQSKWTYYLGLLMYWPAMPMMLISIFQTK